LQLGSYRLGNRQDGDWELTYGGKADNLLGGVTGLV
jgi:hypothetical protein